MDDLSHANNTLEKIQRDKSSMKGKQVLLTGGTGGLGLGVTPTVLAQGAYLTIPYRNLSYVERLKAVLAPADIARIKFVPVNLESDLSVEELVNSMTSVDVLINLVGGFYYGKTHECSFDDWKHQFELNVYTTFLTCKYSLKRMLESGYGRIVTVGSRAGLEPTANLAAYSASKAAVIALTKAIADETRGTNITANTVLPSVINTPSNREAMGVEKASEWVRSESIGQVICFLASEAAGDIRGATIPVYGNL
jgi:NAD(P)-dependent dehydrogenase (short-subunit alcohol dehydrogenase family)